MRAPPQDPSLDSVSAASVANIESSDRSRVAGTYVGDIERRGSGRRARSRDRLFERSGRSNAVDGSLSHIRNIENLMLFVDDDLRETALAITRIEQYLSRALSVLEVAEPRREDVQAVATDPSVLDHMDLLNETLENLRRRLATLGTHLK